MLYSNLYAASGTNIGEVLKIAIGARPASLGGAYTAVTDDIYSIYWNPAGLALITNSHEFGLTHLEYLQEIKLQNLVYARHTEIRTFGFGLLHLDSGKIPFTDIDAEGNIIDTGTTYTTENTLLNFAYAESDILLKSLHGGMNVKFLHERIEKVTSLILLVDLGLAYKLKNTRFGFSVGNLGLQLISFYEKKEKLPTTLKFGIVWSPPRKNTTKFSTLITSDFEYAIEQNFCYYLGSEVKYLPTDKISISIRLGVDSRILRNIATGFVAGAGLKWKKFSVDYAWTPYGMLGDTHRISLIIGF